MELARQIRNDPRDGVAVAAELGITKSAVSKVRTNRTWFDRTNPFAGLLSMMGAA
jgi:predicted transcriptional regulator